MATGILRVKDNTVVDGNGQQVVLRGAAIGGWMKYARSPFSCWMSYNTERS
jgi:hypothetical protein